MPTEFATDSLSTSHRYFAQSIRLEAEVLRAAVLQDMHLDIDSGPIAELLAELRDGPTHDERCRNIGVNEPKNMTAEEIRKWPFVNGAIQSLANHLQHANAEANELREQARLAALEEARRQAKEQADKAAELEKRIQSEAQEVKCC